MGCTAAAPDRLRPWEIENQAISVDDPPDYGAYPLPLGEPYTVVRGDTLYSIAFRLGIDFRELAKLNNIEPPT